MHWSDWLRSPFNMWFTLRHTSLISVLSLLDNGRHFRRLQQQMSLMNYKKSFDQGFMLDCLIGLKRNISKHCWRRDSSAWYSRRKACTQPPKELLDASPQIRGEAALQLRTTMSVYCWRHLLQVSHINLHHDVHVGNGRTKAGNTTKNTYCKAHWWEKYSYGSKCQRNYGKYW